MSPVYGMMASFDTPERLLEATQRVRAAGYRQLEAFTPFPVEGLPELLGIHGSAVPLVTLLGGIAGAVTGFGLQWWSATMAYAFNIGGRPTFSWPSFIPITFELTVLFGAGAALIGMFWLNGLPRPYHAVFNAPYFALATRDRFFLCVRATDPRYDAAATRALLLGLEAKEVDEFDA